MRINEILLELFSKNFQPNPDNSFAFIDASPGFQFKFIIGDNGYTVELSPMNGIGRAIQRVEFGLKTKNSPMAWDIAGTGSSATVFELVAYGLREIISNHSDIEGLFFTAKEPSRRKLYQRLIKLLAAEAGWESRPDLAEWLNHGKEQPYLAVSQPMAMRLDKVKETDNPSVKHNPVNADDSGFGNLPVRMD